MPEESTPLPTVEFREQVHRLEQMAAELIRDERHDEAERIFREIVRIAPRHAQALQFLGSRALVRGELEAAQGYFERAIRLEPRAAMLHQNLGVVLRNRGHLEGALQAFDVATRLRPELPMLWIQRGDMLRALDRREEAVAMYQQAEHLFGDLLTVALNAEDSHHNREQLLGAAHYLAQARVTAVEKATVRNGEALPISKRVRTALQHMSHAAPPVYAEPLQRPTYGYVPDLEAKPFFERAQAPCLTALEQATDAIRAELETLLLQDDSFSPYVQEPEEHAGAMAPLSRSSKWGAYHLYRGGEAMTEHIERCPHTMAMAEALPLVRMEGHAPEVVFSILKPGTHIPAHHGLANYKLTVHLPLIVPPRCAIRVGDETRSWTPGRCLIFDDSFEHEAWNRSDQLQAMLTLEIWHPGLSATEREVLSRAQSALSRSRRKLADLAEKSLAPGRSGKLAQSPAP